MLVSLASADAVHKKNDLNRWKLPGFDNKNAISVPGYNKGKITISGGPKGREVIPSLKFNDSTRDDFTVYSRELIDFNLHL